FLPGGWRLKDTLRLVPLLAEDGADLIDCTSGDIARPEPHPTGPCWQAPYAVAVRTRTGAPTAAVGKVTSLEQAARLLATGACDLVLMGRQQHLMSLPRGRGPRFLSCGPLIYTVQ
ncbi:hypothetical protein AB0F02_36345, partial [Streptomyces sp. NPDC029554]